MPASSVATRECRTSSRGESLVRLTYEFLQVLFGAAVTARAVLSATGRSGRRMACSAW
jgi:hypothetical protein